MESLAYISVLIQPFSAHLEHCKQEVKSKNYYNSDHMNECPSYRGNGSKCTSIIVVIMVVVLYFYFLLAMFQVS